MEVMRSIHERHENENKSNVLLQNFLYRIPVKIAHLFRQIQYTRETLK